MLGTNVTLAILGDGRLAMKDELGNETVLSEEFIEAVWEYHEFSLVKKRLEQDPLVLEAPDTLDQLDELAGHYIAKRNQVNEALHESTYLAYALTELDIEQLEEEVDLLIGAGQ